MSIQTTPDNQDTLNRKCPWHYSIEAKLIKDNRVSMPARFLYILLQSYVGPSCDVPFPKVETLASIMVKSMEFVRKYRKELVALGMLEIKQRRGLAGAFGSNAYSLLGMDRIGQRLHVLPQAVKREAKSTPSLKSSHESASGVTGKAGGSMALKKEGSAISRKPKKAPEAKPTLAQWKAYCREQDLTGIIEHKDGLYQTLKRDGWRYLKDGRMVKVRYWKRYLVALNRTMEAYKER